MGKKIKATMNFMKKVATNHITVAFACGVAGVAGRKFGQKMFGSSSGESNEARCGVTEEKFMDRNADRKYEYKFTVMESNRIFSWIITAVSNRRLTEEELDEIEESKTAIDVVRLLVNDGCSVCSVC